MLIDLFIKAGWYTVPLKGKLERLEGGKKTLPQFEADWRKKYTEEFNEQRSTLAGTITGAQSGIVAIDCDNELTYQMFKTFDPSYDFHFVSKDKPEGGGTIIYKYTNDIGGFKLTTRDLRLDFYSDEGFVYLPTEDNFTKQPWDASNGLPELREMPPAVLALLDTFKAKVPALSIRKDNQPKHTISNRLAPMLDNFIRSKKYDPILFRVLTPYSFRDLPTYVSRGHLHPNDVPQGRGSEYLSKVSAILGADISVNVETYTNSMMLINSLWDHPMSKEQFMSTIVNPMVEGRANIDGQVIWQYDAHWEQMGFIATSLNGDYLESFYDDIKGIYYLINYSIPYIKTYSDKRPVITTLRTLLGRPVTEGQYDATKQLIRTALHPNLEFGHIEGSDRFNLFRQTPYLAVLNNPEPYRSQYVRPNTIIQYFESLIPDDFMRSYVLSFLRTKLTTFNYSPVILYLIGKPGSGKDTLVNILRTVLGDDYVAKPDTKVFLEHYNGWLIDKYIVQLDEYGNKLQRTSEKQEVLGKLKAYTGSSQLQVRAMRQDGFNYSHSTTFIMTANSNPLPIETDDRRVCFIKTPHKLEKQEWVIATGGISHVQDLIKNEIMDFCYYLATEVKNLKADDYVIAPETEDKERLILDAMPALEQIIHYVQYNKWDELYELSKENGIKDFTENWERSRLQDDKLQELYTVMTEGNGSSRALIKAMKGIGHSRSHTTKAGRNDFYYQIGDLHKYKPKSEVVDFQEIAEGKVQPKGIV